jgi:CRISPR-associated protein Cas1
LIRFGDDFVLLCRSEGKAAYWLERVRGFLAAKGLALDPEKTRIVSFDRGFHFLGHLFVRSVVLPSKEEAPPDDELTAQLRTVAATDHARRGQALDEEEERRAGFDRALRVLYVMEPGRRLSLRNQSFSVVEQPSVLSGGPGAEVIAIPPGRVDRIELGPRVDADFEALRHAAGTDTRVSFVDGHGREHAALVADEKRHAALHLAQARVILDPARRLELARVLAAGRIRNQRALLRRLNRKRQLGEVTDAILQLNRQLRALPRAETLEGIRGQEGAAGRVYWPALGRLVRREFAFAQREREPPPDPANLALNFAASLLTRDVGVLVARHGLHPGFGVLHAARDRQEGAVYDLLEEFRSPLIEGLVVYLFNNRLLKADMFAETEDGWRIDRFGGDALIRGYEQWLDRPIKSPRFGRRILWRRLVEEQVVAFAAAVAGGPDYVPYAMDY